MLSLYQRSRRIINGQMLSRFLLIGAVVLLQACSSIKLAYNNAPELGYWWLNGYADFGETQSPAVRAELARLLQWHRNEELPKIAELLLKTQRLATGDVAPTAVCELFAETRERFNAVTNQAEKATVALAMSMTPTQIQYLEGKLTKNSKDWRSDWLQLSGKELFEKRLKANVERAQDFYGTLDERQLTALRGALEASSYDAQVSYTERLRRQQDLLQTLRQTTGAGPGSGANVALVNRTPAEGLAALRGYLERANKSPNPVYRAYSDKLITESCTSFATLHNSTTSEQRANAVRKLAAYERDARDLYSQR
jgi:hypothetical protein